MDFTNLETKLLDLHSLQTRADAYRAINTTIQKHLDSLKRLDENIQAIDACVMNYDLIDLLDRRVSEMDVMGLDVVVSIMQDIGSASMQFEKDGAAEYLERAHVLWRKARKEGFLRLNEVIYKSTEALMLDPSFPAFAAMLDEGTLSRIKLKVLQSRKAECLRKAAHVRSNSLQIFKAMILQELCMFLRLFPDEECGLKTRLRGFWEERPFTSAALFECFVFSVLKDCFAGCRLEDLEALRAQLAGGLQESFSADDDEMLADALVFISVRNYLSSRMDSITTVDL